VSASSPASFTFHLHSVFATALLRNPRNPCTDFLATRSTIEINVLIIRIIDINPLTKKDPAAEKKSRRKSLARQTVRNT